MQPFSKHFFLRPFWLIALVVLLALVAWGGSLAFSSRAESAARVTPTPTKTPTVVSLVSATAPSPTSAPPTAVVVTPTPSPLPSPSPTPLFSDISTPTPSPLSLPTPEPWLRQLAQSYGLDPNRDYIVIDQNNQEMHIIEAGRLAKRLHVTTGNPEFGWTTPAWFGVVGEYWGTFKGRGGVMADEGWWLFRRPGGNFLIHGLPYTLDKQGVKHYKGMDDLGASPASNGCIRLAPDDAAWFTQWNPAGKPIIILPYTGLHANQG